MAPSTIARFAQMLPRLSLMNAYGSTETTSPVTIMPPSETCARPDSVGCAVPCADILVVDDEGREVAAGEQGELWLGGPMVVKGYWDNPAGPPKASLASAGAPAISVAGCRRLRARIVPTPGVRAEPTRLVTSIAAEVANPSCS